MKMVSEQQTYAKLRIAPSDFADLITTDEAKALEYIEKMQMDRAVATTRKKQSQPKDPNAPTKAKKGRGGVQIDMDQL